jgi:predicted RNase H-like HicB family nuclease
MSVLDRFSTTVFFDPESSGYIAVCDEIPGVSAFGVTRADALREFETVLEMAVEAYRAEGWPLPAPQRPSDPTLPSGEFRVRLPRYVHALLARRAEAEGVSQNTLVVALLAHGLASEPPDMTVRDPAAPSPSLRSSAGTVRHGVRTVSEP